MKACQLSQALHDIVDKKLQLEEAAKINGVEKEALFSLFEEFKFIFESYNDGKSCACGCGRFDAVVK